MSGKKKGVKSEGQDAGIVVVYAVVRVLVVYACVLFVHSLLYWGRRALRKRAQRACCCSCGAQLTTAEPQ